MFVRFKLQPRKNVTLRAFDLVENVRIDGKTRQRTVAYLGSIDEGKMRDVEARAKLLRSFYPAIFGKVRVTVFVQKQPDDSQDKLRMIRQKENTFAEDDTRFYVSIRRELTPWERKEIEEALGRHIEMPSDDERKRYDVPSVDQRERAQRETSAARLKA